MELIYTLQLFADAESAYKGIMVHIIQLVILCIPLLLLPTILKTSGSVMSKIAGASDRFHREFSGRAAKGIAKNTPGLRNIPEGFSQFREARKAGYQRGVARRAARNAGIISRAPIGRDAKEALKGQARNLDNEQVKLAQAALQNHPDYVIDSNTVAMDSLKKAYKAKDEVGIRAAMAELSTNQTGVTDLHNFIEGQERAGPLDSSMKKILSRGINDNWSSIKSKDNAVTSWTFSGENPIYNVARGINTKDGKNALNGLTVEQLSTQSANAIEKAGGVKAINSDMAQAVLGSDAAENLTAETRVLFEQAAAPSPPPQNEPRSATGGGNFDQQSEGGVWIPRK